MMLALLLSLFAVPCAQSAPSSAPPPTIDFERETRAAVRWLRANQNVADGSYGRGIEDTALCLSGLAACSDRYRPADGPFVRRAADFLAEQQAKDGTIAPAGASAEDRARLTRLAAQALFDMEAAPYVEQAERAFRALGLEPKTAAAKPAALDAAQALERARELVSRRAAAGFWDGDQGRVNATARALLDLAHWQASQPRSSATGTVAASPLAAFEPADRDKAMAASAKGSRFLLQACDGEGRFGAPDKPDAGITAMCLSALAGSASADDREAQEKLGRGLRWLASLQQEDGSIHDGKLANYITSASIMALARSKRAEFEPTIAKARAFLGRLQADEGEGYSEGDLYYGGIGYGSTERPDLSNLQMALEALAVSGSQAGDPTFEKALRFLQRCQNRSETNDVAKVLAASTATTRVESGNDGGASYAPGDSKAGFEPQANGAKVPRSYGSMTYALLKCYAFAGLELDDPRMQAAWAWCQSHYTLDLNPGFERSADPSASYQGLFYYFTTLARALDALGVEQVNTPDGVVHAWRKELCGRLVAMQSKIDGSWLNHNSQRWNEGNPLLATAYALIALESAMPDAP